jgi:acyl-CoA reductase-like NAD-dependent aldehyde dehydrogenase
MIAAPLTAAYAAEEAFVPILYVMKFEHLDEAIAANNGVKQVCVCVCCWRVLA